MPGLIRRSPITDPSVCRPLLTASGGMAPKRAAEKADSRIEDTFRKFQIEA